MKFDFSFHVQDRSLQLKIFLPKGSVQIFLDQFMVCRREFIFSINENIKQG